MATLTGTIQPKADEIDRAWFVVDAADKTVGRLATRIASILRGKEKAVYTPHVDTGDFVVVINAEKAVLTGNKDADKMYYSHSGRPGALKSETAGEVRRRYPTRLVERVVKGMLPKGKLGRAQLKKLKVYAGTKNPHEAQNPETVAFGA